MEKHQKKLPSNALASSLAEGGQALGQDSLLGAVMMLCGECLKELSNDEAHYERALESDIVGKLNAILEEEGPKVDKSKKKLNSARLDMDTAKSRLTSAQKSGQHVPSKLDNLQTELDEAENKFDHQQDAYATDMFRFLSREHEIAEEVYKLAERQLLWHRQSVKTLEECLPKLQAVLTSSSSRLLFGCPLEEHLKLCKCDVAVVIEQCVIALKDGCMDTEGLFRIAGSTAKVKNLVAAFDARAEQMHLYDPHTIAGALKQYLRDLPEPLLTYKLYPEWTKAAANTDTDKRLQALWQVAQKLPKANRHNLRYLMEFLNELSKNADVTKMNVSNLALVIGPNLIWPRADSSDETLSIVDTRRPAVITEALIEHVQWFFSDHQHAQESISPPPRSSANSQSSSLSPTQKTQNNSPQPKPRRTAPVMPASSSSNTGNSTAMKSPPIDVNIQRRHPPPPPVKPKPTTL